MTVKSESLQAVKARTAARHARKTQAKHKPRVGEPVELHWPDGSIETVLVRLVEAEDAKVERTEPVLVYVDDRIATVPRAWLRPIQQGGGA